MIPHFPDLRTAQELRDSMVNNIRDKTVTSITNFVRQINVASRESYNSTSALFHGVDREMVFEFMEVLKEKGYEVTQSNPDSMHFRVSWKDKE